MRVLAVGRDLVPARGRGEYGPVGVHGGRGVEVGTGFDEDGEGGAGGAGEGVRSEVGDGVKGCGWQKGRGGIDALGVIRRFGVDLGRLLVELLVELLGRDGLRGKKVGGPRGIAEPGDFPRNVHRLFDQGKNVVGVLGRLAPQEQPTDGADQAFVHDQVPVPPSSHDLVPQQPTLPHRASGPGFRLLVGRLGGFRVLGGERVLDGVDDGGVGPGVGCPGTGGGESGRDLVQRVEVTGAGTDFENAVGVDDGRGGGGVGGVHGFVDGQGPRERVGVVGVGCETAEEQGVGMRVGRLGPLLHLFGGGGDERSVENRRVFSANVPRCNI